MFGFGKKAPDEVTAALEKVLAKEIAALDRAQAGLGERFLRYVAQGEPLGVLGEIAGNTITTVALGTQHQLAVKNHPFYTALDSLPPAVTLRFAKGLAASVAKQAANRFTFPQSAQAPWLETLMLHAAGHTVYSHVLTEPVTAPLSMEYVERMLTEEGLPAASLLTTAFLTDVRQNSYWLSRLALAASMTGFAQGVERHCEAIRGALVMTRAPEQRVHVLGMLEKVPGASLAGLAAEIAACATASSKAVRLAAQPSLRALGALAIDPLEKIAVEGAPPERSLALRALWELGALERIEAATQFVIDRRGQEKTRSVLEVIDELEAHGLRADASAPLPVPELPAVDAQAPLPATLRPAFDEMLERINRAIAKTAERSKVDKYLPKDLKPLTSRDADELWAFFGGEGAQAQPVAKDVRKWWVVDSALEEVRKFVRNPGVETLHVLRAYAGIGQLTVHGQVELLNGPLIEAVRERYRARKRPSLLELEALAAALGIGHAVIARSYMGFHWVGAGRLAAGWDDADVWPFFARHMDIVHDWLRLDPMAYAFNRVAPFDAVAAFPEPPAELVSRLFEIALGPGKADRPMAQRALAKLPGKEDRVIGALGDRKAEVRAVAAQWLQALRCEKAIPALEAALRKEGHDAAVGALLAALESLGVAVDKFLDRDGLPREAAKALAKGIPAAIAWFPWDALPQVTWSDTGQPVAREVLQWFLVQATKVKSPEPHVLLRRYAAMFAPADRERFGQFVLEAWLAEDLRTIDREEAEKRARDQARNVHGYMQSQPQYYKDNPHFGKSEEELFAMYLAGHLRTPCGSAIDSKGILAVAAACCGRNAAPAAARYLKEYYGMRAAQGKALIAMLAWVEHPSATQLMLSVGNRFRTRSFQEEAVRQAEALAERKGWTLAELADRTIPSAGFDEAGELELAYGERKFVARLVEHFKVELFNEEGKKIAALPEPRKDEDEALAKEAKKAFSAAKKEIKTLVQMQTERLYESLCTQRMWRYEDWDLYLGGHPVMRRLLQGLVWGEMRDGKVTSTFRPLDDGTLTDVNDAAVALPPEAQVGLAHDTNLEAASVAAWQKHLADYEVMPVFQQFGKGTYALPVSHKDWYEIGDFRGHVLEAFALRGRATKLGYQRGAAQDGGWFYGYHKRFPTLGLEATIEFTGNGLPEENRTVALQALSFERASDEPGSRKARIALSEVPAVLLSECYNDARLIAAEGSGFDADWEKKTQP